MSPVQAGIHMSWLSRWLAALIGKSCLSGIWSHWADSLELSELMNSHSKAAWPWIHACSFYTYTHVHSHQHFLNRQLTGGQIVSNNSAYHHSSQWHKAARVEGRMLIHDLYLRQPEEGQNNQVQGQQNAMCRFSNFRLKLQMGGKEPRWSNRSIRKQTTWTFPWLTAHAASASNLILGALQARPHNKRYQPKQLPSQNMLACCSPFAVSRWLGEHSLVPERIFPGRFKQIEDIPQAKLLNSCLPNPRPARDFSSRANPWQVSPMRCLEDSDQPPDNRDQVWPELCVLWRVWLFFSTPNTDGKTAGTAMQASYEIVMR